MTYRTESDNQIKSIEKDLDDEQVLNKKSKGKYLYVKPRRLARGTVEIHEYVGIDFKGYVRIQKFKNAKGKYLIKSVDKGPGGFSHGWIEVDREII